MTLKRSLTAILFTALFILPSLAKAQSLEAELHAAGDAPANPGPLAHLSPRLRHHDIEQALRKVADWQLTAAHEPDRTPKFNQQWTYAPLYDGLLALSRATGDPRYAQSVAIIADSFHWQLLDTRFPHADDEALGQAYLDLYRLHPDPIRLASTQAVMDRLAALAPQDDPSAKPVWWWCDALFMAPPVLVRMYSITGDRKYLDTLDRNWSATSTLLYHPAQHLFFRDAGYLNRKEANGQPLFWSRGNGWVLAGLANVLQFLPPDYPSRPRYLAQFREMAARIIQLQDVSGLWKTGLLDPAAYRIPEVSGSAFYTYALAWGINAGILDARTYRPVVARAWAGMLADVYADGRLGSIQPIGAAPDAFTPSSSYVYGVGGFLLAGSELLRMTQPNKPRPLTGKFAPHG